MSTSDKICNDASKSSNDYVHEVIDNMLQNIKIADEDNGIDTNTCANCGKEGTDVTNTCNKCKLVMYCNAACKKKHRSKHKKDCERRVAELHDEQLFKQPPPKEDCPICFLRLPSRMTGSVYMNCCGKVICRGCIHAPRYDNEGNTVDNQLCPFCRAPHPKTNEEKVRRNEKRVELGDPIAIYNRGCEYASGRNGLIIQFAKALELWHRAGELGYAIGYHNIGNAYSLGEVVKEDEKKANHYWELAAMQGHAKARGNLGIYEAKAGKHDLALRHFMIAVKSGYNDSLGTIRKMVTIGHATKDDYKKALEFYQAYLDEIKSDQRDEAAAADDEYKYY